jgi:hypothetical protein
MSTIKFTDICAGRYTKEIEQWPEDTPMSILLMFRRFEYRVITKKVASFPTGLLADELRSRGYKVIDDMG